MNCPLCGKEMKQAADEEGKYGLWQCPDEERGMCVCDTEVIFASQKKKMELTGRSGWSPHRFSD